MRNPVPPSSGGHHALWAWSIAVVAAAVLIVAFRHASPLVVFYRSHPGAYGVLAGLSVASFFFLVRFGLKLTPVFGVSKTEVHAKSKSWLGALFVLAFLVVFGLITHRWLTCVIGMVIGIAVWIPYYLTAKPRTEETVEPSPEPDNT
jgi:hypothetical protein